MQDAPVVLKAATNKCLARSNKTCTGGKATNKRGRQHDFGCRTSIELSAFSFPLDAEAVRFPGVKTPGAALIFLG
jgi:hypothetical protein